MYDNALTFAPVQSSEIADLLAWRREVIGDVFGPQNEITMNTLLAENERYYDEAIANGTHLAVFALMYGERVGCGSLCMYDELPSPDNPSGRCAYVMNVYVRPEYRRRGIGKLIVLWLVDQARMRGIPKIYLESTVDAKPMYRAIGFVDMPDYMIYRGVPATPPAAPVAAPAIPMVTEAPGLQMPSAYGAVPPVGYPAAAPAYDAASAAPVEPYAYGAPSAAPVEPHGYGTPQVQGALQSVPSSQPYVTPQSYAPAEPAAYAASSPDVTAMMPPVAGAAGAGQTYEGAPTYVAAPDAPASGVRPLSSCAVSSFLLGLIAALSAAVPFISLEQFAETLAMMHPIVDIVTIVFGGIAIVLGIVGLALIAKKRLRGRALAIIGLIVGVAACAVVITLWILAATGGPQFDFDVSGFYRLS